MNGQTILGALILGLVEGLTEFIPVSSTAHLLLLGHFIGFESSGKTFEVTIQLGAILALMWAYLQRIAKVIVALPSDREAQRFALGIALAFAPAALIGATLYQWIKTILFEAPMMICITLIAGGFALLLIERIASPTPTHRDAMKYPMSLCLKIGLLQCLALIPGVSRSGATIAGALLLGADRRSAAEFSFFLAMPTMIAAVAYDLYRNRNLLEANDLLLSGIGFVMAFASALLVVRWLLDFVSRHGFSAFAWWRIAIGTVGIIGLLAAG